MRKFSQKLNLNILWLSIFSILVGIFLIFMPKYVDDYMFMYHLSNWFFDQGVMNGEHGGNIFEAGLPWDEMMTTWRERYQIDNARFGNIIVVFFLLLPKWVGSLLVAGCWIWVMISGLRLVDINIRKSALVPLAILLWGFFMPWRNHQGSLDYQFNYIIPNALMFLLFTIMERKRYLKRLSPGGGITLLLTGFICGGWQEAMSLPVALTLGIMICIDRNSHNGVIYRSLAGLTTGLLWIFCAPGQWARISSLEATPTAEFTPAFIGRVIMATIMFWVMVMLLLITLARKYPAGKRLRNFAKDRKLVFMVISGFISAAVTGVTYADARVGWWATTMGIFGILYILNRYYPDFLHTYNRKSILTSTILMAIVCAHWITVDIQVFRIRKSLMQNIEAYLSAPEEPVFVDVIDRMRFPIICANMPDVGVFTFGSYGLIEFYKDKFGTRFAAVPRELEYVTPGRSRKIPGSAGMMEFQGRRFMVWDKESHPVIEGDYGNGAGWRRIWTAPFVSKADGRRYLYVYIYEDWVESNFKKLERVDLLQ